jgi:hypothetical protein
MEELYAWFSQLQLSGEYSKKLSVMKESLQKVEKGILSPRILACTHAILARSELTVPVCFTIKVRGSEYPKEFLAGLLETNEGPDDASD